MPFRITFLRPFCRRRTRFYRLFWLVPHRRFRGRGGSLYNEWEPADEIAVDVYVRTISSRDPELVRLPVEVYAVLQVRGREAGGDDLRFRSNARHADGDQIHFDRYR